MKKVSVLAVYFIFKPKQCDFFDRQIADIHFDLSKSIEVSSVKTDCNLSALFESKIGVRYAIDMF